MADPPTRVANLIYALGIPLELTRVLLENMPHHIAGYLAEDTLEIIHLLKGFQVFCRQQGKHWAKGRAYREAGPQLLLQAYLQ